LSEKDRPYGGFHLRRPPAHLLACLLPDRRGRWTRNELIFLSWCRYTGVIPATVASILLADGLEGAETAVSLVAFAVCTTLLLQATTAGYVAGVSV
jgi:cell volume regulation protein A